MPSPRYSVERLVGRGGMGSVFRGIDRETGDVVALKLVRRAGPDDESVVRREAGLLARVAHPNVMRLHAVDSAEDGTWLVCEWIDGRTLAEAHAKMGPVSAVCCAVQIFAALAAMRGAGVVHRDVKPGNLMLTADGRVKLIDFGVAFHPSVGRGDTVAGSPRYMDPRILGGGGADGRSDMYGAGLVVAELLLGEPLWPEMAPLQLHQFLMREGLARLRRTLAFAHPAMRALIEAAVAPCIAPETAGASDPEAACAALTQMLRAWGVSDPAAYLAEADGYRDEAMGRVLRGEAERKLADGALKAKERAPWFAYAASLGVGSPAGARRGARGRYAAAGAVLVGVGAAAWGLRAKPSEPAHADPPKAEIAAPSASVPAPAPAVVVPAPVLVSAPAPVKKAPGPPAKPNPTKVYLSADAWADVFIDGHSAGRIPRAKPFELAPGPHQVRLASPVIETLNTTVVVPRTTEARITLSPKKRSL